MPLYDHRCPRGHVTEAYKRVDEREIECPECGETAERIFSSRYAVIGDVDFLTDNITGEPVRVDSRVKLRALLRDNGVSEKIGKGWV